MGCTRIRVTYVHMTCKPGYGSNIGSYTGHSTVNITVRKAITLVRTICISVRRIKYISIWNILHFIFQVTRPLRMLGIGVESALIKLIF